MATTKLFLFFLTLVFLTETGGIGCTNDPLAPMTGTAGGVGGVGGVGLSGQAGATGTAGIAGVTGAAGRGDAQSGTAGTDAATANATSGTAGTVSIGAVGSAGVGEVDAGAENGAAGAIGAAGNPGNGDAATGICMNSAVWTPGGSESNCPAKALWVATALPTPPSGLDGIPDSELLPSYAIDGDLTTRYSSGTPAEAGDYFQVDLGATAMVSGITVSETTSDDLDVAEGYAVEVSTDGDAWTTVASCTLPAQNVEVVNWVAVRARYVRYTNLGPSVNGTNWFSIHELDVICN
jgi:hypothetical protein